MKKVLVLTSKSEKTVAWKERSAYLREFCDDLNRRLRNEKVPLKIVFTTHDELLFEVVNGQLAIYDTENDTALEDYAFVHFKNWAYNLEPASVAARFLEKRNVPFANSEVVMPMCVGKLSQMFRLAEAGLPVPDTLYGSKQAILDYLESPRNKGFEFPLIIKDSEGSRGDHNFLAKTPARLAKIYDTHGADKYFVIQKYIPNIGDYRILFIGLDNHPLVFKRMAVEGSHLNNTSKGGSAEFVGADELSAEIMQDARKAAEATNREITGVDILIDKHTGQHYVLEINSTPAIATGFGVPTKTDAFVSYLKSLLKSP